MWPVLCGTEQCTGFVVCVPRVCRHRHPEEVNDAALFLYLQGSIFLAFCLFSSQPRIVLLWPSCVVSGVLVVTASKNCEKDLQWELDRAASVH